MTIIASDGSPLEPFETEILVIYGGERFDIVLNANQNSSNYWIRVKGLADCGMVSYAKVHGKTVYIPNGLEMAMIVFNACYKGN